MIVATTVAVFMSMAVPASTTVIVFIFIMIVKIPISIAIPAMLVFYSAPLPGPITHKIPSMLVVRTDPIGSFIGRDRPVTCMPSVMVSDWVPVAFHPDVIGPWWRRFNVYARRRWRSNRYANRNLRPNR
jgi:hypothetical protein